MTKRICRHFLRCALLLLPLLRPSAALAVTVYAPDVAAKPGQRITVPVMIDDMDNLAGLKLVLTYDEKVLTYTGGAKTPVSTSLMHIVNDRKPGRLVLVMAGARGIRGKKITVSEFHFITAASIEKKTLTALRIVESQLMSDDLKDIKHDAKRFRVEISPAAATAAATTTK